MRDSIFVPFDLLILANCFFKTLHKWKQYLAGNLSFSSIDENLLFELPPVKFVIDQYLLLTEFEGRAVGYWPSFFPIDLWLKREARGL